MAKTTTRNEAAVCFWARQDRAQRARDAQHERYALARLADCRSHVEAWELFEGFARLLGRERALALLGQ